MCAFKNHVHFGLKNKGRCLQHLLTFLFCNFKNDDFDLHANKHSDRKPRNAINNR